MSKLNEVSAMLAPRKPARCAQPDRVAQAGDRERVLRAAVDVALGGVDRERGDRHALEDPERVALEDAAVHERAGVALVRVADDVLLGARAPWRRSST